MHRIIKNNENSKGQGLIIVALVVFVLLLIILRAIADTLTDVSVSTGEEQSTRAFSAAQAGVDKAFFIGSGGGTFDYELGNGARYEVTISSDGKGEDEYNFPYTLVDGESNTLWFVSHKGHDIECDEANDLPCFFKPDLLGDDLTMNVCFDRELTDLVRPAVEVAIYYDSGAPNGVNSDNFTGVNVLRRAYDPDPSRNNDNNFEDASETNCTVGSGVDAQVYDYQTLAINLSGMLDTVAPNCTSTPGCLLIAKIRMLYNDNDPTYLGVKVEGDDLPSQANKVDSVGIVGSTGTGDTTRRKLEAYQSFPELPPIFDAAIFSPPGIEK